MKKLISVALATLVVAGVSVAPASAKKRHRQVQSHNQTTTGSAHVPRGNNAELGGNNASSASGSNSLNNPNNGGGPGSGL